jgi:hypothetical protein
VEVRIISQRMRSVWLAVVSADESTSAAHRQQAMAAARPAAGPPIKIRANTERGMLPLAIAPLDAPALACRFGAAAGLDIGALLASGSAFGASASASCVPLVADPNNRTPPLTFRPGIAASEPRPRIYD